MKEILRLFSYRRCPFAIRARITLYEKNLEFEVIEEDLKNKSAELLRLHPEGRVPLLVHGELAIYESSVITEYIDEKFAGSKLMPDSPELKATLRMWTVWCNNVFKKDIDGLKYGKSPDVVESSTVRLKAHLTHLEEKLSESDWLVQTRFTLADIHVFPFFRQLERVNAPFLTRTQFPKVYAWFDRISEKASVQKAMEKV